MIRAGIARALERGAFDSTLGRAAASVWARRATVTRSVVFPAGATVIGVGGATLGGSYKTPLTLALATALRARGASVHVVGHGYGVRIDAARAVRVDDTALTVGDDAAWLGHALRGAGVPVFVGERGAALRLAAAPGSVVIVDALLQTRPRRLSLSLLAVDADAPWGSGACPPAGDLRAPVSTLLAAADAVVAVHTVAPGFLHGLDVEPSRAAALDAIAALRPVHIARAVLTATLASDGSAVSLESLRDARVGVVLAIARPERVLRSLLACGISPVARRLFADHAAPRALPNLLWRGRGQARARAVDLWLTTPKCATKLGTHFEDAPVAVLGHALSLPGDLLARLDETGP